MKAKKYMIIGIFILMIALVGSVGTYAWFTWKSTSNTSLTMSIGKLADVIFTSGNDISTSTLSPVYNYTDGELTTFSINNRDTSGTIINYGVKLNITSIATELKSTSLKYVLLKNNIKVKEGDFSTISTGSTTIYSDSISSSGTTNFTFYLYIDGNSENNLNMINKSLVGTITVSEGLAKYYMKGYDTSFNAIDHHNNECANAAFPDEGEQCLFEYATKFLNSNIIAAQISTINVVKSDKVPTGVGNATDISRDQNGSVLLYSKISSEKSELNGFDLYDIYISTKNGKVYLTNGALLFEYMINLKSVDLANMYTDEVTDMSGMFAGCLSLESIDASNFNTLNVTNMNGMFDGYGGVLGVSKVKNINISNFNTSNVTDMSNMFYFLENLTTIYASNNFNTSAVTKSDAMFRSSSKLVGGNGTKYNSSYEDKTYARIDTSSTPGYFTLKN